MFPRSRMPSFLRLFVVPFLIAAIFLTLSVARAFAQTEPPAPVEFPDVTQLFAALVGIPGFALLASAIINALKKLGWVKDGQSGAWLTGFNLLGVVLLFIAGVFNIQYDSKILSEQLQLVANALIALIALFGQNKISVDFWYPLLKQLKLPLISTSFKEVPQEIKDKLAKG